MKEKNKNMEQIGKALDDEMLQEVIGGMIRSSPAEALRCRIFRQRRSFQEGSA